MSTRLPEGCGGRSTTTFLPSLTSIRRSRLLPPIAFGTTFLFSWTTLAALPVIALAQAKQTHRTAHRETELKPIPLPQPPVHLTVPTFPHQALDLAKPSASIPMPPSSWSLLDEVGRLPKPLAPEQIAQWKSTVHNRNQHSTETARAHIRLGEWELAANQEPDRAIWHFRQAQKLALRSASEFGLATYDTALALYYAGAYSPAAEAFHKVLKQHGLHGFDRRTCALFSRHADACAGYHAERAKLGIPEPPRLDPLCGVAALAACLRTLGFPSDKPTLLAASHVTGEGNSLQDVMEAAHKLGAEARSVGADDAALMALPKPMIAYVEHDHFICLLDANKAGISYLCSDCGPWPGGKVDLSWKQWHKLEPSRYAIVYRKGSELDRTLQQMAANSQSSPVATLRSHLQLTSFEKQTSLLTLLAGHLILDVPYAAGTTCGNKPEAQHCCPCQTSCPQDGDAAASAVGASAGDPVNLATGEEEYTPQADLTVYNPIGPSIRWGRLYNSLRSQNVGYQSHDFGMGWSHTYNIGVVMSNLESTTIATAKSPRSRNSVCQSMVIGGPGGGGSGGSATGNLVFPNGSVVNFTAPSSPSASTPHVACTVSSGTPFLVEWDYSASSTGGYFVVTFPNRSKWITTTTSGPLLVGSGPAYIAGGSWYPLGQQVDQTGHLIQFNYTTPTSGCPLLSSITDGTGSALLTLTHSSASPYGLQSVSDRYGRSVYYHIGNYPTLNVPSSYPQSYEEVDHVSEIVPTGTASPPDRYAYGYQEVGNGEGSEQVPFLHTLTVPSPTGSGSSTATINYDPTTDYVSSTVDANGNKHVYTSTDASHTLVTITDSLNNVVYSYTSGFNTGMSDTGRTNGSGVTQYTKTFSDPYDPYRPSSVADGNGHTTYATWDQFGNCLTATSARGTVTTNTINYTNFALGERTSIQIGSKTPTTFTYYEPSGLLQSVSCAKPGDLSGTTVTASFTYDALGNLTQETGPGNNSTTTETVTFNYTSDPAYSYTQSAALHQPLTRTDSLGHVSHFRFDARGNKSVEIDALGNEGDFTYNLADQMTAITLPATGMTGSGRAQVGYSYLYPGGPKAQETQTNEASSLVYQVLFGYGAEGEKLSRTGTIQPFTATYDAAYRMKALTDGNGHTTSYSYTTAGYLGKVSSPNANVATGYDILSFTSFDNLGNILQRVDGRGVVTNYLYSDPENKLTDVQYPATPSQNVHCAYDAYGRQQSTTDGSGSQSWTYDFNDLLLTATTTYTGVPAQTLSYAYYPDESRQSLTLPDSTVFTYGYDAAGRMTSLQNPSGQTWNWTYLNNDWLSQQTDAGKVNVNYTHNARGVVTGLANTAVSGGSTLSSYAVNSFAPTGSVGQILSAIPAASGLGGTTNYTQDTRSELTGESSTVGSGYTLNCAYDAAENPTTFRGATLTFNSDNQNSAYTYDGAGNPTTYRGTGLAFDAENRMVSYGTALTAGYRGDGMRASKTTAAGATYFVYDGVEPVLEVNSAGTKTAVMTFGPAGALARTTSTRTLLYTSDLQGNVSQQVDASSGTVVASYAFDGFGGRLYSSSDPSATSDPYSGFGGTLGYFTDWETGLQLLGHRYYDDATGRFLNRDPMDTGGGINVYSYVSNDPLDMVDPSGYEGRGGGTGGAGGGAGHTGGWHPGGPMKPIPIKGPGGGITDVGAPLMGCGMGILSSILTSLLDQGLAGLNMSLWCPIVVGCGMGAICGIIGGAVGGGVQGCIAGGICGALSSAIAQICAMDSCGGNWPSADNTWCQMGAGFVSGCVGGFCGPLCGIGGAIVGGLLGDACNRLHPAEAQ